jgi:hypothetical protein
MEHGRLIRVTTQDERGHEPQVITYVVAEPDRAKAEKIIRTKAARIEDDVEAIGRASQQLLKAFNLASGEFIRADD